jgi:tetratricopeptide (TPR) repeat protein
MKKLMIGLMAMALCLPLLAKPKATPEPTAAPERSQAAYLEAKAKANALEAAGQLEQASEAYLDAAESTPWPWVEAWQRNSAAYCLIQLAEGKPAAEKDRLLQKALDILEEALPGAERSVVEGKPSAVETIKKNKLFCERSLGLKPWPVQ